MQNKNVLFRFLRYLSPFKGTIVVAMFCAMIVSMTHLGHMQILAESLDSLKLLEGYRQTQEPIPIRFFNIKYIFEGFEITLTDVRSAINFFLWMIGGVLILVFVKGIFSYGSDFLMERVGNKFSFRLRNVLYEKIVSAPLGTLSEKHIGDIMTRATDDVRMLQQAIAATANIMRSVIQVILFILWLFYRNIEMTIFCILVLPFIAYFISRIGKRVRKESEEIQQRSSDIYTQLKETLSGIKIIKSFTAERIEIRRFRAIVSSFYNAAIRRARFAALLPPIIEIMAAISIAAVFGFGCWQVIVGNLSIGWFLSYFVMVTLLFKPIKTIGTVNIVLQQGLASAERIFHISDYTVESTEIVDKKLELTDIQGTVQFQDISFAYREKPVINHVSFTANQGEIIALVGPSGSGKTTLLNLLQRFYTVDSGRILIDDIPIDEVTLNSLRKNIALVPQDTFLFDGTVLDNIQYGSPKSNRQQVIDAAKQANAHDFVTKLPNGYDTEIGEAGGTLSGGEQQRIAIARAVLKNAPILVLDEATSALDTQSETIIQESLTNLMQGRTCFIIAHRLSTVMRADNILVIKDGEIVENGKHIDLYEKGGLYRDLCEQQMLR